MKSNIIKSIRITLVLIVILCVIYPVAISLAAKLAKGHGDGETIMVNGKVVGYANIGQSLTQRYTCRNGNCIRQRTGPGHFACCCADPDQKDR